MQNKKKIKFISPKYKILSTLSSFSSTGAGPGGAAAGASALLGLGPHWKRGCVSAQTCNEMTSQAETLLNYITMLNKSAGKRSAIPVDPASKGICTVFGFIGVIRGHSVTTREHGSRPSSVPSLGCRTIQR